MKYLRLALLPLLAAVCGSTNADARVTTIAGNGLAGIVDGAAGRARFLLPSGIAVRKSDGAIFVSDEAAQRIRELTRAGNVITVAGSGALKSPGLSVEGGFADGPALRAKFNRPAGLAIGPDGALYIADSLNGCIRKLLNGIVSTAAGKCYGLAGPAVRQPADGPAAEARFVNPRGIVFDPKGNLYIGDPGAGLRRLGTDGNVTTIHLQSVPDNDIVSVAYGDGADPVILATSPLHVVVYHPSSGKEAVIANAESEGLRPFGEPNSVAGIDSRQFLFTDASAEVIRYLRLPAPPFVGTTYTRAIAGDQRTTLGEGAGFRDGALSTSQFNAPMGIATDGKTAYVADAGNRRIRKITLPQFRVSETGLSSMRTNSRYFEIALIGASYVFYDALGDDSICAALERALDASHRFDKPVRCHAIRIDSATLPSIANYVEAFLPNERMDAVIVYLSAWQSPFEDGKRYFYNVPPAEGIPAVRASLQRILQALKQPQTALALTWGYLSSDVSDTEGIAIRQRANDWYPRAHTFELPNGSTHATVEQYMAGIKDLPIVQYDLYNDLVNYEKGANPLPLYEPNDLHFSPRGHAFLGSEIAKGLLARGFRKAISRR